MPRKLDADALLSLLLIGLMIISYVALVYVIVIAIGTPSSFRGPGVDFLPPWWLNLIAFILIALTALPVYRWARWRVRGSYLQPAREPLSCIGSTQPASRIDAFTADHPAHHRRDHRPHAQAAVCRDRGTAPGRQPCRVHRVTAYGNPPKGAAIQRMPLTYYDTVIGELRVAARRADEPLSPSDLAVLRDLARQVGIALYAAQLTDDLQRARERLVIAREDERRRIRNDLHDGLAPTLSSLQLQLGAARNLIRQDPDQAEALLNRAG